MSGTAFRRGDDKLLFPPENALIPLALAGAMYPPRKIREMRSSHVDRLLATAKRALLDEWKMKGRDAITLEALYSEIRNYCGINNGYPPRKYKTGESDQCINILAFWGCEYLESELLLYGHVKRNEIAERVSECAGDLKRTLGRLALSHVLADQRMIHGKARKLSRSMGRLGPWAFLFGDIGPAFQVIHGGGSDAA